ncbi:MAG: hypothetical protein ABIS26_01620 [Candidatus Paceibacterota bacterium]
MKNYIIGVLAVALVAVGIFLLMQKKENTKLGLMLEGKIKENTELILNLDEKTKENTELSLKLQAFEKKPEIAVTVLSPNGGEVWVKGSTRKITWQDLSENLSSHEIKLENTDGVLYTVGNTNGTSFDWFVGKTWNTSELLTGKYKIKVCQTGSQNCDSSDKTFEIKDK